MEVEALRELVERGSREKPHLASRLERAAYIVATRVVERQADGSYRVPSEDGLRSYVVADGHCGCSDYNRHGKEFWCKHRLAVGLQARLNGKAQEPEGAPCSHCGATDRDHICVFCNVCRAFTPHVENARRQGRWDCCRCEARAGLIGARFGGRGRAGFWVRKLELGVYGPPVSQQALPKLQDLYD